MPSVKHKRTKNKVNKHIDEAVAEVTQASPKRRPAQEAAETVHTEEIKVVKVQNHLAGEAESLQAHHQESSSQTESGPSSASHQEGASVQSSSEAASTQADQEPFYQSSQDTEGFEERIHLRFPGDTVVKRSLPTVFGLAESVVNEWAHNGSFDSLPIKNPFVRYATKTGLKKAKEVETKVLESPVTEKVITKVFEAGFKAQMTLDEIRDRFKTRR